MIRHGAVRIDAEIRADPRQLERPPWSALTTTHARFSLGDDLARRYQRDVAPMAAIRDTSPECLQALGALMQPRDVVGLFDATPIAGNKNLTVIAHKTVEQMVYAGTTAVPVNAEPVNLTAADVPEMMRLVELTKPGPFAERTIALGSYIGLRIDGRLVAMAGERMRFPGYAEISAVCVLPDYRRRGYSALLVRVLMGNMLSRGETPFLHIFTENTAAAALYKQLGFLYRRTLTVTVLGRSE